VQRAGSLLTGEEIQAYRLLLADFLRLGGGSANARAATALRVADRSTANDNAAGLRGGGAAVEHLRRILARNGSGFIVLFRLGCLEVIGERFGTEAVQDSLMAVSAFLTHTLRSDDALYHWSDSSLLAVLESPASEQILSAAMQRIVNNNRDITIKMGDRAVMLRIPLTFSLTPVAHFNAAEDLLKLSRERETSWSNR
jgi:GGDEF domain-containing protein